MMKPRVIWMFSGQGSQYFGMGRKVFDREPVFRESLERCDRLVRPWIGTSLIETIWRGERADVFDDTRFTHLAICAVQWAMVQTLQARGERPDLLLGYSLGEITAHIVAGTISLEAGLELLDRHASLMESATPEGGMLAILEKPDSLAPLLQRIPGLWVAARNFERHCVVSGTSWAIDRLQHHLEADQITMQRLPVRRAFHSPLMDPAESDFVGHLKLVRAETPRTEVISATTGDFSAGLGGLWSATREPVDFWRAIRRLEDRYPEGCAYWDLGPSGTLATFVKYIGIRPESTMVTTITPWG